MGVILNCDHCGKNVSLDGVIHIPNREKAIYEDDSRIQAQVILNNFAKKSIYTQLCYSCYEELRLENPDQFKIDLEEEE